MQHYNLRVSSVTDSQLNEELKKYGAKTFGSKQRKYDRLRRFQAFEARARAHEIQEGRAHYWDRKVTVRDDNKRRATLLEVILSYLG